jgi:hypothetical protein
MVKGPANAGGVRRDRGGILLPPHCFHCSISLTRPTIRSGSKRNFRCNAWSAEAPKACMQRPCPRGQYSVPILASTLLSGDARRDLRLTRCRDWIAAAPQKYMVPTRRARRVPQLVWKTTRLIIADRRTQYRPRPTRSNVGSYCQPVNTRGSLGKMKEAAICKQQQYQRLSGDRGSGLFSGRVQQASASRVTLAPRMSWK